MLTDANDNGPITNAMLTLLMEVKEIRLNHLKLYTREKGTPKHNTTFFYYYTTPRKKSSFLSPLYFTILNGFSRKKKFVGQIRRQISSQV